MMEMSWLAQPFGRPSVAMISAPRRRGMAARRVRRCLRAPTDPSNRGVWPAGRRRDRVRTNDGRAPGRSAMGTARGEYEWSTQVEAAAKQVVGARTQRSELLPPGQIDPSG